MLIQHEHEVGQLLTGDKIPVGQMAYNANSREVYVRTERYMVMLRTGFSIEAYGNPQWKRVPTGTKFVLVQEA